MEKELKEIKEKTRVPSKKDMILSLFNSGVTEVETIAAISGARPSYVGSVLQREGLIDNYFDLYTSTSQPMNVYSKQFQGKLGFRDVPAAERSVGVLEGAYRYFDQRQDRAGQHHTLDMALTMLDRARWTGKLAEAEIYRRWLVGKLSTPLVEITDEMALAARPSLVEAGDLFAEIEEPGTELKKAA
jgi:hypothetical protein